MLWLHLSAMNIGPDTRVLHIAPERGIFKKLQSRITPENYHFADLFPELFKFAKGCRKIDLTDLDHWPSQEYDLIIHSHVLEHIPCNLAYPVYHLHRMLKPTGKHVFIVPFMPGKYAENFQDISEEERVRTLSQKDHVRRFGREDVPTHLGSILDLPENWSAERTVGAEQLRAANIPEREWNGFTGCSVMVLDRDAMKFLGRG
ncbi:hypothetical protein ACOXXX_18085 [Thalassococcus sp. BH17M4-6]|uniref:hypothetical protein n=1 Tax=Thalassococcus sp. BH17M4-6 TaxID=3413148 RepID=UPI003BBF9E45